MKDMTKISEKGKTEPHYATKICIKIDFTK